MIVAIILADADTRAVLGPNKEGGNADVARVVETVLRGPFGGTLIAAESSRIHQLKEALKGFTLQFVEISEADTRTGANAVVAAALTSAHAFRQRWERAMTAATGRFDAAGGKSTKGTPSSKTPNDWLKHLQSADVKVRGLARSFERDGVLLIPAGFVDVKKEHLAQLVESFAREAQNPRPKPFAQAVFAGIRSWPVLLSIEGAATVAALPPQVVFSEWLSSNVENVLDVNLER